MGRTLADHIYDHTVICKDLQVTCEAVALELYILHTDHHEARLNIDLRYSVHKDPPFCPKGGLQQYKNIQVSCKNSGSIFSRAMD